MGCSIKYYERANANYTQYLLFQMRTHPQTNPPLCFVATYIRLQTCSYSTNICPGQIKNSAFPIRLLCNTDKARQGISATSILYETRYDRNI